jgi:hypothetical protein
VNATLSLQANATGFTATPQVAWWIEKAPGSRNALYCGLDYSASPPPETDCPCGYIAYNSSAEGVPTSATYHAPSTPRVCHPTAQVMQFDGFIIRTKATARAEVTVTP